MTGVSRRQTVRGLSLPVLDVDPDWSWTESCVKVLQYVTALAEDPAHGTPAVYRSVHFTPDPAHGTPAIYRSVHSTQDPAHGTTAVYRSVSS